MRVEPLPNPTATEMADRLKARSTLVMAAEPVAIGVNLAAGGTKTLATFKSVGEALVHSDFPALGGSLETLADTAFTSSGPGGQVYQGAVALNAGITGLVGAAEIWAGLKDDNPFMIGMGVADIIGGASFGAQLFQADALSIGLAVASTAARLAMVAVRPSAYSRAQQIWTVLGGVQMVTASMFRNGVMVAPALGINFAAGLGLLVYSNVGPVQRAVDGFLDRL